MKSARSIGNRGSGVSAVGAEGLDPEALEALREASGITLSADGVFRYRGERVPNDRVQALFHRGLTVREDGRVTLRVGRQWCYVEAEGVARFVDGLAVEGGALRLRTRAGEERTVGPNELVLAAGPDDRFYVWAPAGAPPALLARGAHQQLAGLLDVVRGEGGEDALVLPLGGGEVPVLSLSQAPGPNTAAPSQPGAASGAGV